MNEGMWSTAEYLTSKMEVCSNILAGVMLNMCGTLGAMKKLLRHMDRFLEPRTCWSVLMASTVVLGL